MRQRTVALYPITKFTRKKPAGSTKTPAFYFLALIPTLGMILITQIALQLTGGGYRVIVLLLLAVLLYTTYRSGVVPGVISGIAIAAYNFALLSQTRDVAPWSLQTFESGFVIAVTFPVLAIVIGNLKARNDHLLQREHDARMRAEESARQLRFMAESMPQKIFTSRPDGTNVYANEQWAEYTGASKKAMRNWGTIVHPHDAKENIRVWKESLATGTPFQFEHRLRRADGTYVWHLTRAEPMRDKKGRITLWIGSSTDIEDIRRARKLEGETARLIKQREQLMELNRAKDEFISIASHQLRTPATAVKQYINMALDGYGGKVAPKLRDFLEKANETNERQLDVINDLLQVAQVDAGKVVVRKEPVDVNQMIAGILHDQRSMFNHRDQKVRFSRKQRDMTVLADPTKLRSVIENVLDNASKYSEDHTTISVGVTKYKGSVRIRVTDQGVGIAKADMPKVFEKFIRIDNPLSTKVGGNGLGLYWVKKVVELHGGKIAVDSKHGSGSTFIITLPAQR